MNIHAISPASIAGIALATAALAAPVSAQSVQEAPASNPAAGAPDRAEVQTLPIEYRRGPSVSGVAEIETGADGVETITRTRRIQRRVPPQPDTEMQYQAAPGYRARPASGPVPHGTVGPSAAVFEREQWLDECERRTSGRENREKGGIIGSLLGAIAGGIAGNRIAGSGERLGGTLIGAGVGGLGGLLIGSLIGGGRDRNGNYDCEAALDGYLSQYGHPMGYRHAPHAGYGYSHAQRYPAYGYSYAPPQQIVYVPVTYYQQQRVIVRETVREEIIPGANRSVPSPAPAPRPIKTRPIKTQPIPVKGY